MSTRFTIGTEREVDRGWEYEVALETSSSASTHLVRLDWRDHDHWSGGNAPPSRVIEVVLGVLADSREAASGQEPEGLPERFDASTVRRWAPSLDQAVRKRLDRAG